MGEIDQTSNPGMCILIVVELLSLVYKDANEGVATQLQLDRAGLGPLVEIGFQELLCKGGLRLEELSAEGLASQWLFLGM